MPLHNLKSSGSSSEVPLEVGSGTGFVKQSMCMAPADHHVYWICPVDSQSMLGPVIDCEKDCISNPLMP